MGHPSWNIYLFIYTFRWKWTWPNYITQPIFNKRNYTFLYRLKSTSFQLRFCGSIIRHYEVKVKATSVFLPQREEHFKYYYLVYEYIYTYKWWELATAWCLSFNEQMAICMLRGMISECFNVKCITTGGEEKVLRFF